MLQIVEQIKTTTQLRRHRVHKFKAKVKMNLTAGSYTIKTAESTEELMESFQLRHEVFNNEFRGLPGIGLDFDRYDYFFDHLIIIDNNSGKIIGTYRLNCSTFSEESYTALEFDLSYLRLKKGPHLELGRACIHKSFRKGAVISLLWRGIAEYMKLTDSALLFGCSSLKINGPREAALVYRYFLENDQRTLEFNCQPTSAYKMQGFEAWYNYFSKGLSPEHIVEAEALIPSLLKSYLKLGAKIACEPAFDQEFDCIDMLTVLKRESMAKALAERFGIN